MIFMAISHQTFQKNLYYEIDIEKRAGMSMLSQGASYLFGVILLVMAVSFFCQAIHPDVGRDERNYYHAMEELVEKGKI